MDFDDNDTNDGDDYVNNDGSGNACNTVILLIMFYDNGDDHKGAIMVTEKEMVTIIMIAFTFTASIMNIETISTFVVVALKTMKIIFMIQTRVNVRGSRYNRGINNEGEEKGKKQSQQENGTNSILINVKKVFA